MEKPSPMPFFSLTALPNSILIYLGGRHILKPPLSSFAAPPRFRESSERLSVRKGDRAVLECAPSAGDRPMDLFWRRNGIDVMRGEDAREVFNSPVSLLNLCFCVAILRCSNWVSNGNDSPHLSPNLRTKIPKRESRSEMGLLNTRQVRRRGAGKRRY